MEKSSLCYIVDPYELFILNVVVCICQTQSPNLPASIPNTASLVAQWKGIHLQCRRPGFDPSWEDPLEEGMATHSSMLAWRIPGTEGPGGLQSIGLQRVRHN